MVDISISGDIYHLRNARVSYVLAILPGGIAAHLYFGARLESIDMGNLLRHAGIMGPSAFSVQEFTLDQLPQEYPSFGLGDLREGALAVRRPDGSVVADLRFVSAEILDGKPALEGLPATFGENGRTLRLHLRDAQSGLEAILDYALFDDIDAVVRSARLINGGSKALTVTRAMSLCLDLPDAEYELITLSGAWARERGMYRRALTPGEQGVSTRSGSSSLQTSPFMALVRPGTTERTGEALGLALVYSGNFTADCAVSQFGTARALMGINDRDFAWQIPPGAAFQTPEAVAVWSEDGLGGMSRAFHRLWNCHLLPSRWARRLRPVLLNSWEAAYFDFDEDKLLSIAQAAREAGVELFVMDDGWFGHRDDDSSSLGDWQPDPRKLPGGLGRLGDRVRALGLEFGIWMEPEMVNPDSELYRAHPDWALHIPGQEPITSRHQLTLDMGREDVQQFVVDAVTRTLRDSGASYLKWDMNRRFSNIGSAALPPERQGEVPHRYMLGLYRVLDQLTRAFPDVLFEGCASGGGRFDAGMLYYSPQIWCSDNTDALCRMQIQWGTSMVFPPSTMGSHVSAVPNHQTGRVTPLNARFAVALGGQFGYELDPRSLSDEERGALRRQIEYARTTYATRMNGAFYRLHSPFAEGARDGNDAAWIQVSEDRAEAVLTAVRRLATANTLPPMIRLEGLDPQRRYRVAETGDVFTGAELMRVGLCCPFPQGDAAALIYTLQAE